MSQISSNLREEAEHSYYDESSMLNKPKSMAFTALGYYVVIISEKWRTMHEACKYCKLLCLEMSSLTL